MKIRSLAATVAIGATILLAQGPAEADELKVLSALALQPVMEDLGPKFERVTGHKLVITFGPLGGIVKLVQDGVAGDVVMIPQPGIERLAKDGKVVAGTENILARSGSGVAVRKGAPKPDISSPEALKRTLLAAKSISYSDPAGGGASGVHFAKVLDRLGIAEEMKPKTIFPKSGFPGQMVANGEAELGVGTLQGLMAVTGIELVGPLPGDLQDTLVFVAAIMANAPQAEAGKALIEFLRTPESAKVIMAKGMEPATPLLRTVAPGLSQQSPPASEKAKQIVALVHKAAALVESQGKAAFAEFRKSGSEWFSGDTYLFAYDMKLNVLLNPAFPKREGTNPSGQKDSNGKLFHDEFVKVVQSKGSGWVDYMFPKPGQTQPSQKWSYVKAVKVDEVPALIGSGFYPE